MATLNCKTIIPEEYQKSRIIKLAFRKDGTLQNGFGRQNLCSDRLKISKEQFKRNSPRILHSERVSPRGEEVSPPPGPRNYRSQSGIGSRGPMYSIRRRLHIRSGSVVPGPGAYNLMALRTDGRYILSGNASAGSTALLERSQRFFQKKRKLQLPGPGYYDSPLFLMLFNESITSKNLSSFSRTFSKSTRRSDILPLPNNNPGPGYYEAPSSFRVPNLRPKPSNRWTRR